MASLAASRALADAGHCGETDIVWHDGARETCLGPWEHKKYVTPCYKQDDSSACGIEGYEPKKCYTYEDCRHGSRGVQSFASNFVDEEVTWHNTSSKQATMDGLQQACNNLAEQRRVDYIASRTAQDRPYLEDHLSPDGELRSDRRWRARQCGRCFPDVWNKCCVVLTWEADCRAHLNNIPTFKRAATKACPVADRYDCDDLSKPKYYTCRHSSHGTEENPAACGVSPALHYSSSGAEVAALERNPQVAAAEYPPVCTTCDHLPMDTAPQVQSKFQCLQGALDSNVGEVHDKAVGVLKRLWELRGHLLTDAQRQTLHSRVYNEDTPTSPDCGADNHVYAEASAVGNAWSRQHLRMCAALAHERANVDVTAAMLPHCTGLWDNPAMRPHAQTYAGTIAAMVDRVTASIAPSAQADRALDGPSVTRAMEAVRLLGVAAENVQDVEPSAFPPAASKGLARPSTAWVYRGVSRVWHRAYSLALGDSVGNAGVSATERLQTSLDAALDVVLEVLNAAGSSEPGTSAQLLIGDGLTDLVDQLDARAKLVDIASRFGGAPAAGAAPLADTYRMIEVLTNATEAPAGSAPEELAQILKTIRDHHGTALQSLATATHSAGLQGAPAGLWGIASAVRTARLRTRSYETQGFFTDVGADVLRLPLTVEKKTRALAILEPLIGLEGLAGAMRDYDAALDQLLGQLQNEINGDEQSTSLADRLAILLDEYWQHMAAKSATARTTTNADATVARLTAQLATLATADPTAPLVKAAEGRHVIRPSQARYVGGERQVAGHEVSLDGQSAPLEVQVPASSILRLRVDGDWSPICAVQLNEYVTAEGVLGGEKISFAATGPEGYWLSVAGAQYMGSSLERAEAEGWSSRSTHTQASCVAGGATLSLGPRTPIGTLAEDVSGTTRSCDTFEYTEFESETQTSRNIDGQEVRVSASFRQGLRSPFALFEDVPAGALLAVALRAENDEAAGYEAGSVYDIDVVTRDFVRLYEVPVTVRFIVNEWAGPKCDRPVDEGALTLTHSVLAPAADSLFERYAHAMAAVRARIRAIDEPHYAQTTAAYETLLATRNARLSDFFEACQCAGIEAPGIYSQVRTAWLDSEIARLRAFSEVYRLDNELSQTLLAIKQVQNQSLLQEQMDSLRRVQGWRGLLRADRATKHLGRHVQLVAEALRAYIHPFLRHRYTDVLDALYAGSDTVAGQFRAAINQLGDLRIDRPLHAAGPSGETTLSSAQALLDIAEILEARLALAQLPNNEDLAKLPLISLTLPWTTAPTDASERSPEVGGLGALLDPVDAAVDPRAFALTEAARAGQWATVSLTPEDVFRAAGGSHKLLCTQTAPVVRSAGLVLEVSDVVDCDAIDAAELALQAVLGDTTTFMTNDGPLVYELDPENPDFDHVAFPVGCGTEHKATERYRSVLAPLETAQGISPFTSLAINFAALAQQWPPLIGAAGSSIGDPSHALESDIVAMHLVFEVEYVNRTAEEGVWPWVAACSAEAP